ncbi:unnamed protein product [Symbiodinium necroappetens]|uniref:Uncharacterized protein n=1 Tax=Symbiodinium necroappetens TaxID=1628268 RepID=A0A812QIK7_9DINO|nr:unnamed protein product [Symbiodinium necroappetens]
MKGVLEFVLAAWTAEALRDRFSSVEEQVTKELSEANVTGGQPGGRLGTVALKTVQQGLKRVRPGQAAKGFQFKAPRGLVHGFHPPNYAFNGLGRGGVGLSRGFGGRLGGMPNQLGRMPMQGVARRFASGSTGRQITKGVRMIGMQNLEGGQYTQLMGRLIVEAVESAAHLRTGEEIAKSIRKAGWRIWYGTLHNDITVLVSKTEVGIGRAAEDFVGRFRIQQGGKDLYVTLLKRAEYSPPFLKNVNFGVGDSDKVLLRTFGQGLQYVRNIFQQQSLQFMRRQIGEVAKAGVSESAMAQKLEQALVKNWGRGWNVVVSKTEMEVATNVNDIMAKFKVNDVFFTIVRQMV